MQDQFSITQDHFNFYVAVLNSFAETGNELLQTLDDIVNNEYVYFDPELF